MLPALGLFAGSLALLSFGHFIQFDDTSGFGSGEWVMPFGVFAGVAATASVLVASTDRTARRLLGGAVLALDVFTFWQARTNDGFRFIWEGEEAELFYFQVGLALIALVLLTPVFLTTTTSRSSSRPTVTISGWTRFLIYLAVSLVVVFAAFFLGTGHFETTQCSGPDFGGECDVAPLEGLLWAAAAIVLMLVAVIALEVVRIRRRRIRGG